MHKKYGLILHMYPHELHASDHEFFNILFAAGSACRHNHLPSASVQGAPSGIYGTSSHDVHRMRRSATSGFFSKQSVALHGGLIYEKVETLCEVFQTYAEEGTPFNIRIPLPAYTTDFYCALALGERGDMRLLEDQEKAKIWRASIIDNAAKLMEQLRAVIPDPNEDVQLSRRESLPWTIDVWSGLLRLSLLIMLSLCPFVLVSVNFALTYLNRKTPVGMTFADLMMDPIPRVFPDPRRFDPETWLESCPIYALKTNRAWAEIYIAPTKTFH
ncbi:cytochrome P450 [Colletotrichum orchidophilum]|uniref:Cytochrome P450 n=1 Tax=Colletotrichum orchidophilum TaxID=1209926 RepID=A0A1G4AMX2_9PEZI|nr:cytochrome P450 [Colletotrichum orchidophilum]OHE90382.1 cytochrome P450 [Colletotrichum orchidophilum]